MKTTYNKVIEQDNCLCQEGELLTDKELEHLFRFMPWRKPKTQKVEVDTKNCYICFGARFMIND